MSKALNQISDPQPAELLKYLPEHQVLICKPCRYAVQPNAISRHLKDIHHVLRSRRRPFVQYAANFCLKNPKDVIPPKGHQFPVPYLTVEQGFTCRSTGCGYHCVSNKRIKSHWMSTHGRKGENYVDWQTVPLQTFFRGNLVQYFTNFSASDKKTSDEVEAVSVLPNQFASETDTFPCNEYVQVTNFQPTNPTTKGQLDLDVIDTSLYQHYISSTSLTISTNSETETIWRDIIPRLAKNHPFLMHGILSCSAQHLAYLNPGQRQEYTVRACIHQDRAMPLFQLAIDHPNSDNCHAILAFSHLLPIYSIAAEHKNKSSLLLVNNTGGSDILPSWLHFLRAGCCMLCTVEQDLANGPLHSLLAAWDKPINIVENNSNPSFIKSLLAVIPETNTSSDHPSWPDDVIKVYRTSAVELARSFLCMESLGASFTTWDILRIWPMRISFEYMTLLGNEHPGALILLAHYCVLLKRLQSIWYFDGEAVRLMSAILRRLDVKWHCHIQGPLQHINTL